ncbi:MAG: methyltransferase domain-containing protein [Chloroflexi bacterium]|nr:methyltransferase domain-containing protein [Chloroflexota bacterium]
MQMSLRQLFNLTATGYEERIIPAFGPLAGSLVAWIQPTGSETALDIGAGTGIAARLIAPHVNQVLAVDFAPAMTQIARQVADREQLHNLTPTQADAHYLPFRSGAFDLVLSSFGLNATIPRRVFAEAYRVLRPGGRLSLQEWGGQHEFDAMIVDILEEYAVYDEDAPADLVALRDLLEIERPWYRDMQTEDDFLDILEGQGFVGISVQEHRPATVHLPVNAFIDYKMAWTAKGAELAAMDPMARGDCLDQLRARLHEYADREGVLEYSPLLFRAQAARAQ